MTALDYTGHTPTDDGSIIRINAGQASVSLALRNNTVLSKYDIPGDELIRVDSAPDGTLILVATRPPFTFSSGERLIWALIGWLNGAAERPTRHDLHDSLDAENVAAVESILAAEGWS